MGVGFCNSYMNVFVVGIVSEQLQSYILQLLIPFSLIVHFSIVVLLYTMQFYNISYCLIINNSRVLYSAVDSKNINNSKSG